MKKELYSHNFAPRLIQARNEMELSQRDFAEVLNISKSTIASYEVGRTEPSLEMLAKIAKATGHTTDYFLGLADD